MREIRPVRISDRTAKIERCKSFRLSRSKNRHRHGEHQVVVRALAGVEDGIAGRGEGNAEVPQLPMKGQVLAKSG